MERQERALAEGAANSGPMNPPNLQSNRPPTATPACSLRRRARQPTEGCAAGLNVGGPVSGKLRGVREIRSRVHVLSATDAHLAARAASAGGGGHISHHFGPGGHGEPQQTLLLGGIT